MPKLLLYLVAAAPLLEAPLTRADVIGTPTNPCINDSCDGAQYTLFYDGQALPDSNPLTETFRRLTSTPQTTQAAALSSTT